MASSKETNYFWNGIAVGAIVTGAAITSSLAVRSYYEEYIRNNQKDSISRDIDLSNPEGGLAPASGSLAFPSPETIAPPAEQRLTEIPLLDENVLNDIKANLLSLEVYAYPGYEQYFVGSFCNGFFVQHPTNKPIFVTAKHCIPETIEHTDGKVYSTVDSEGKSILGVTATDFSGNKYSSSTRTFYPGGADVIVSEIGSGTQSPPDGLFIAPSELQKFEGSYLVKIVEGKAIVLVRLHFLKYDQNGTVVFLDIDTPGASCIPGTSGSAVVNSAGEVVGVHVSTSSIVIDDNFTKEFNLSKDYIGRNADLCISTNIAPVRLLVGSN